MTQLRQYAEAVLYHHTSWLQLEKSDTACKEYAALIHLADRIDTALHYDAGDQYLQKIFHGDNDIYPTDRLSKLESCLWRRKMLEQLTDGSYRKKNVDRCRAS